VFGIISFLLLIILASIFFYNLGVRQSVPQPVATQEQKSIITAKTITEKEKIPPLITGTVGSVDENKVLIKQFASFDLNYEIRREDVNSIVGLEKNFHFSNNPDLEEFIEKNVNWSKINSGSQVNFTTEADGSTKLIIYPADYDIGPPK